jgi:hypothetical protein
VKRIRPVPGFLFPIPRNQQLDACEIEVVPLPAADQRRSDWLARYRRRGESFLVRQTGRSPMTVSRSMTRGAGQ